MTDLFQEVLIDSSVYILIATGFYAQTIYLRRYFNKLLILKMSRLVSTSRYSSFRDRTSGWHNSTLTKLNAIKKEVAKHDQQINDLGINATNFHRKSLGEWVTENNPKQFINEGL